MGLYKLPSLHIASVRQNVLPLSLQQVAYSQMGPGNRQMLFCIEKLNRAQEELLQAGLWKQGRKLEFLVAHLDLFMQVLLSDVVIDGPHDLLVDVVCIGRVLVAAHAQESPETLLPVPGALHDEVLQPSHIHALIKLHPCTCAHMPPNASPPAQSWLQHPHRNQASLEHS